MQICIQFCGLYKFWFSHYIFNKGRTGRTSCTAQIELGLAKINFPYIYLDTFNLWN